MKYIDELDQLEIDAREMLEDEMATWAECPDCDHLMHPDADECGYCALLAEEATVYRAMGETAPVKLSTRAAEAKTLIDAIAIAAVEIGVVPVRRLVDEWEGDAAMHIVYMAFLDFREALRKAGIERQG